MDRFFLPDRVALSIKADIFPVWVESWSFESFYLHNSQFFSVNYGTLFKSVFSGVNEVLGGLWTLTEECKLMALFWSTWDCLRWDKFLLEYDLCRLLCKGIVALSSCQQVSSEGCEFLVVWVGSPIPALNDSDLCKCVLVYSVLLCL